MSSTDIQVRERAAFAGLEQAANLPEGSITLTGLNLPQGLSHDQWVSIVRGLSQVQRWTVWAVGDAMLWGVAEFGEDAVANTVDGPADRYNVMSRLTGLHPDTLRNYMSLCARIAKSRRRVELSPLTHEPVAKLTPDEQTYWLEQAVSFGWTRAELRARISGKGNDQRVPQDSIEVRAMFYPEHIKYAARKMMSSAHLTDQGVLVPVDVWEDFVSSWGDQ